MTPELKELEQTILGASDKIKAMEYDLFQQVRAQVAENSARVQRTAALLAQIDVYVSLATVAAKEKYVCPVVDMSDKVDIRDGRHPVVEQFVRDSYFVPNDTLLDTGDNRVMLITAEYGGKIYLYAADGFDRSACADRLFCAGGGGAYRDCGQDFHPRRGIR